MAERVSAGIQVVEQNGPEHAIARVQTGVTAFIGRTLKGPVNTPVDIDDFAEFQHVFGGLWQPSTLGYAVEQYFENGGRKAIVVRVCNGGRPPTIALPAGSARLKLRGLSPGTREYLRASVDYDGLAREDSARFNLVVQRVRSPGSEAIEDQEIFRNLSVQADDERFVVAVLAESRLVRVDGDVPAQRPDRSPAAPSGAVVGYVLSGNDGDDGGPISDYDIIGSAQQHTGLFALAAATHFDLLCIPPLTRDRDVGLSTWLVAARFCRDQHAMLLIDPPIAWNSARAALDGLRGWPFRADNAALYFPRVLAFDRLRGRWEQFGSAAAAAGMLARTDVHCPVWSAVDTDEPPLRPSLKPAVAINDAERVRMEHLGINTLLGVRASGVHAGNARTLADGNAGATDWRYLAARRLSLFITASVENGTRWTIFERNGPATWMRARAQVSAFLEALAQEGALVGATPEDSYFVICDARLNSAQVRAQGKLCILFGFAPSRPGVFQAFLVTHRANGSQVRQVWVNRMATSGRHVTEEIETQLLRGLVLQD
ncbi:MAG: hypothetical protein R3E77_03070 [Steroidobacteraceae bacterium]